MPNTPLWKATGGLREPNDVRTDSRNSPILRSNSSLVFGPTSNCWSLGPIVSEARPSCRIESTGKHELNSFLATFADHSLGLLDSVVRYEPRFLGIGGIFGHAQRKLFAFELRGGFSQGHRQRPGHKHPADRAAVDHGLQVVELVDLQAAEDDQLCLDAAAHRPVELGGDIVAKRHALHRRRHNGRRAIKAARGKRLVDIDTCHLGRELACKLCKIGDQLGQVIRLGIPKHALDGITPRVFKQQNASRLGRGNRVGDFRGDGLRTFIPPVGDQGHVLADDLSESLGNFLERPFRFAADVTKDDLLPAPLDANAERAGHGLQSLVSIADLGARLGIDVAAYKHGRAARHV